MPVEDYPTLPEMPPAAGIDRQRRLRHGGRASRRSRPGATTRCPALTGVRIEIEGDTLTLVSTDRYRLAVRELRWNPARPDLSAAVLVPARALADTARALTAGAEVSIALALPGEDGAGGEGMIGFEGGGRRTTTRLLGGDFPRYQTLLPEPRQRGRGTDHRRRSPRRSSGSPWWPSATPRSGCPSPPASWCWRPAPATRRRRWRCSTPSFDGDDLQIAFNPTYLLDGLTAIDSDTARISFTEPGKPALITGKPAPDEQPDYRYLLMPIRLGGVSARPAGR